MGKTFKEVKKELFEAEDFVTKYSAIPLKDYPNLATGKKVLVVGKNKKTYLRSVMIQGLGLLSIEDKFNFYSGLVTTNVNTKDGFDLVFRKTVKKVFPDYALDEKTTIEDYTKQLGKEDLSLFMKAFDGELFNAAYREIKKEYADDKNLLNYLEKNIPEVNTIEFETIDLEQIPILHDEKIMHNEITELKKEADLEFNQILDQADEILVVGKEEYLVSQIPESMSQHNLARFGKELDSKLLVDNEVNKYMTKRANSHLLYDANENATQEERKANYQRAIHSNLGISKENMDKIKAFFPIFDKINGNGVLQEEAFKVYGFGPLLNTKKELQNAVKNKDSENIKKLTKKYNDLDKEYETLFQMAKDLNQTDLTPDNITTCRNTYVPIKYRMDYESNGIINAIYYLYSFAKMNHYNPEDILNNPTKLVMNEINKTFIEDNYVNNYFKENGAAKTLLASWDINPFGYKHYKSGTTKLSISRFLDNIIGLETNPDTRANLFLNYKLALDALWSNYDDLYKNAVTFNVVKFKENQPYNVKAIKNLVAVEPEDFSYADFLPDTIDYDLEFNKRKIFDRDEYLASGRTTPDRIAYRIIDFVKVYDDPNTLADMNAKNHNRLALFKGLASYAKHLLQTGAIKSSSNTGKLLNQLIKNPNHPTFSQDRLNVLKAEVALGDYYKKKDTEALKAAVKAIGEVSKNYDNKLWITKKVSSFAKSQFRHITNLKEELVKSGNISIDNLNLLIRECNNNHLDEMDHILRSQEENGIRIQIPEVDEKELDGFDLENKAADALEKMNDAIEM